MSRSLRSYEAIVLQTHDIGEADRFCIVFTREGGRRVARARAVRKPGSRLGGLLLPLRHVQIEIEERGEYAAITAALDMDVLVHPYTEVRVFSRLMQGVELLLRLTEDCEPLPGVFDLLLAFRSACSEGFPDPLLPFGLRLLHLLGHLPLTREDPRFERLSHSAQSFVRSCAQGRTLSTLCAMPGDRQELQTFLNQLLVEHLSRPLVAARVGEQLS